MNYLIARQMVRDVQQFQNQMLAAGDMLRRNGVTRTSITRNVDNDREVITVLQCADLQMCRQLIQSPEYRQCTQSAGATGQPQVMIVEELATTIGEGEEETASLISGTTMGGSPTTLTSGRTTSGTRSPTGRA